MIRIPAYYLTLALMLASAAVVLAALWALWVLVALAVTV